MPKIKLVTSLVYPKAEAADSSFCTPSNGNSFASFGYPGGAAIGGVGEGQHGCVAAKEEAAVAVGNKA